MRQQGNQRRYPRTARLNELVQQIIAEEIALLDDDRLVLVTVMSVEVDADLRHATVYVETPEGADRDEDVLERELEEGSKRRPDSPLEDGRPPDPEDAVLGGHAVGEDDRSLFGEPHRPFVATPTVIQRLQAAW